MEVYGVHCNIMKKLLNMILIIALLAGVGVLLQGCMFFGHGEDADPFAQGENIQETWDEIFGNEEDLPVGIKSRIATENLASDSAVVTGEILALFGEQSNIVSSISAKSTNKYEPLVYSTYEHMDLNVVREDGLGGSALITGKAVLVKERYNACILFADIALEYSSYTCTNTGTRISGSAEAKIMASSYDCDYHTNIHLEFTMLGNLTVDGLSLNELEFSSNFNSYVGETTEIHSSILDTESGFIYCFEGPFDITECLSGDGRSFDYFCDSDDRCQISESGHESCAENMPTGEGGHCNLGCCSPLPPESNTCNNAWTNRRECDPTVDTFYTMDYNHRGISSITYDVKMICTPDGLWSPPCLPGGLENTCPFGSVCIDSDNVNWGKGLEDYGYCSCTGE